MKKIKINLKAGSCWLQRFVRRLRWTLADWLSFSACKLRGQKWYRGDCWANAPGNRAADLKQSVWERCVALELCADNKDPEWLNKIDVDLSELGQIAGENWGHIMPPNVES